MPAPEPPSPRPEVAAPPAQPPLGRGLSARAKAGLIALGLLALLGTVYVTLWFVLARELRSGFERWAEARRADGYAVAYSALRTGGFPFVVRVSAENPSLGRERRRLAWTWGSRRLDAELRPWTPGRVAFKLRNPHRLATETAAGSTAYAGAADVLELEAALGTGAWTKADARAVRFRMAAGDGAGAFSVERAEASAERLGASGFDEPWFRFVGDAQGIRFPEALPLPLGNEVRRFGLALKVLGAIPERDVAEALAVWRDAGGTAEVERLSLAYGPLALEVGGTLAVDRDLQPVAAFTAKAQGYAETIDALRDQGMVRSGAARTAKLVLGALAKRPEGGGRPVLEAALTIQDRLLYVGPVALVEVPTIVWK